METQNSYKRTVAGSVGAGMGAIFNGSGRTYYILEHKTSSKYHTAGESQKIIIDQIEMGRDASCQVRFDESFETVSRKHAAIVRDGNNWQLIHLSSSNPTLVNGRPISGSYYLQSGDEIQLSVNGPRMGFIQPQGKQALTSSIKLTERMNLFRQQALRPYRRAIWALSILLLVAVLGLGTWNFLQHQEIKEQEKNILALVDENKSLDEQIAKLDEQIKNNPENEQLKQQITELQNRKAQVITQYRTIVQRVPSYEGPKIDTNTTSTGGSTASTDNNSGDIVTGSGTTASNDNASATIRDYNDDVYTLKIRRISVEKNGRSFDPHISLNDVACGTGFLLSNGTFVTARQNIEPWIYDKTTGVAQGRWRELMKQYAAAGCDIIIEYDAYSTAGTAAKLSFNNKDFIINRAGDSRVERIEIEKEVRGILKDNGIDVVYIERHTSELRVFSPTSNSYAKLPGIGGSGIPYNAGASLTSEGGTDIQIAGFAGVTNIHNLNLEYFKSSTSHTDTQNGTIVLQSSPSNSRGYLGSPAFIKDNDGNFRLVGMFVGTLWGKSRMVPVANFN